LLQNTLGTINLSQSNINSMLLLGLFGFTPNITCTDCMHGAVTIINQDLPGAIPQDSMNRARNVCGAPFTGKQYTFRPLHHSDRCDNVDGGIPPGLLQTAVGSNTNVTALTATSTPTSTSPPSISLYVQLPPSSKKSSALGKSLMSFASLIGSSILLCTLLLASGV
jgi:hypothetical protein